MIKKAVETFAGYVGAYLTFQGVPLPVGAQSWSAVLLPLSAKFLVAYSKNAPAEEDAS